MQVRPENLRGYPQLHCLDLHTAGEPLRIVLSGYPTIPGNSMLAKRRYLMANLDHLRQLLMYEPRGHADMYGALITEPVSVDGDMGVLFMHNEGYSSMCGHGILALVTALAETGAISLTHPATVRIDAPAGRIQAYAEMQQDKLNASFDCVPSFVEATHQYIELPGVGRVDYDIAFGGAYYAYVDADKLGLDCSVANARQLIDIGRRLKQAIMPRHQLIHPEEADLGFLYGVIFTSDKVEHSTSHSRHVCIFADGELDRSPTGTGVSGRAALLRYKTAWSGSAPIQIESIIGSTMSVSISHEQIFGPFQAVIPRVSGQAYITGEHRFMLHAQDPFPQGFFIR
ncbi:proline racemase family protein [Bowmanella denitrificans]|uniref:Proline racemase family protein n=1 Tax=Bowmanella denitrificans TaxID=366582 RepID=A0ABN0WL49_9ALTE|nr:proline racemase family protein [Bowmanella denitrificans]